MFLERLLDLILSLGEKLVPFSVVSVARAAGVLRLGKYNRTLPPGLHWKWPLIEEIREHDVCMTTVRLPPQTLTTKDRVCIVVTAIIKYEIKDVEPFICDVWDARDVLADVTMGALRKVVADAQFEALLDAPPEDAVLEVVRKQVNRYGFSVKAVTLTDLGRVRSIRLIQQNPANIEN